MLAAYSTLTKNNVDSITIQGINIKDSISGLTVDASNIAKEDGSSNVAEADVTASAGTYKATYGVSFVYKGKSVYRTFTQTIIVQ